jgi:hypothetical protein
MTLDTHRPSASRSINEALAKLQRRPVGVIISRAIRDEIKATKEYIANIPVFVDPEFSPSQFEIVTNENLWEAKTAKLKEVNFSPYSDYERRLMHSGVYILISAIVGLCAVGYLVYRQLNP